MLSFACEVVDRMLWLDEQIYTDDDTVREFMGSVEFSSMSSEEFKCYMSLMGSPCGGSTCGVNVVIDSTSMLCDLYIRLVGILHEYSHSIVGDILYMRVPVSMNSVILSSEVTSMVSKYISALRVLGNVCVLRNNMEEVRRYITENSKSVVQWMQRRRCGLLRIIAGDTNIMSSLISYSSRNSMAYPFMCVSMINIIKACSMISSAGKMLRRRILFIYNECIECATVIVSLCCFVDKPIVKEFMKDRKCMKVMKQVMVMDRGHVMEDWLERHCNWMSMRYMRMVYDVAIANGVGVWVLYRLLWM